MIEAAASPRLALPSGGKNTYSLAYRAGTHRCGPSVLTAMATANQSSLAETLGLIAGNRTLPLVFARQARQLGAERLVAVAFEKETDTALAGLLYEVVWLKVGQLSKLIDAFKERQISRCVMVGQIAPKYLFDLRPDLRAP